MNGLQGFYESPELVGEILGPWVHRHFFNRSSYSPYPKKAMAYLE